MNKRDTTATQKHCDLASQSRTMPVSPISGRSARKPETARIERIEPQVTARVRTDRDTNATQKDAVAQTLDSSGRVYFISTTSGGPVKVGWSKNPRERLATLQTAHWEELEIIGCIPGPLSLETEIQWELVGAHIRGEWFERAPVLAWIKAWEEAPDIWGVLGALNPVPLPEPESEIA